MNKEILRLKEIKKSYPSGDIILHVLKGINLKVFEGDFIGIMGPSGSGKSTLLSIMGTLEKPDSGEVFFGSKKVEYLNDSELSFLRNTKIGFVFQFHNLLPEFNAIENVMLPLLLGGVNRSKAEDKARMLLEKFGLLERAHHYPSELSGGERQRIAVARALVTDPDVILADEPTGNLDRENAIALMELLKDLNASGTTIVLVTHNESLRKYFTRTYRLFDGFLEEV